MSPAAPDPRESAAPRTVRARDVRPGMVVWNPYGGARGRAQVAGEPRERPDGAIEFDTADGRTALFRPGFRLYLDTEATAQLSAGPEAVSAPHKRPGQVQQHPAGPDPSSSTQKGSTVKLASQHETGPGDGRSSRAQQLYIKGAAAAVDALSASAAAQRADGDMTRLAETETWLALAREDLTAANAGIDADQLAAMGPDSVMTEPCLDCGYPRDGGR